MPTELFQARLARVVWSALDAVRKEGSEMTEEELMGIMIANHFQWNGVRILKTAAMALEDANYHDECAVVLGMAREAKQTHRQEQ